MGDFIKMVDSYKEFINKNYVDENDNVDLTQFQDKNVFLDIIINKVNSSDTNPFFSCLNEIIKAGSNNYEATFFLIIDLMEFLEINDVDVNEDFETILINICNGNDNDVLASLNQYMSNGNFIELKTNLDAAVNAQIKIVNELEKNHNMEVDHIPNNSYRIPPYIEPHSEEYPDDFEEPLIKTTNKRKVDYYESAEVPTKRTAVSTLPKITRYKNLPGASVFNFGQQLSRAVTVARGGRNKKKYNQTMRKCNKKYDQMVRKYTKRHSKKMRKYTKRRG